MKRVGSKCFVHCRNSGEGEAFAAGTLVVWDVDVLRDMVVRVYRASEPDKPTVYRSGQVAEAEPALPGWSLPVDDLLP